MWELYKNATEKIQGTYPHMAEILILQTSEKRRNNSAEYQSMQFQLILKKRENKEKSHGKSYPKIKLDFG